MAQLNLSLDLKQAFDFKKDIQTGVGYITQLKVGTEALPADFQMKKPLTPTDNFKAVVALQHVVWETGPTDSVNFAGTVSIANRQKIALLVLSSLTNIEVEFKFEVYGYDPLAKKYFLSFHSGDAALKGIVEKNGGDLNIAVADEPSYEVQSPQNFAFQIGIKPQPIEQDLHLAVADQKNVVKKWGITQG